MQAYLSSNSSFSLNVIALWLLGLKFIKEPLCQSFFIPDYNNIVKQPHRCSWTRLSLTHHPHPIPLLDPYFLEIRWSYTCTCTLYFANKISNLYETFFQRNVNCIYLFQYIKQIQEINGYWKSEFTSHITVCYMCSEWYCMIFGSQDNNDQWRGGGRSEGLVHKHPWTRNVNCIPFLFVWLWFFVPFENFLLTWRRRHCRWRAANSDRCSALMAIEQWGFFSVPYLLWHRASVYNGYLRGPVTLTPNAERLAV